MIISDNLGPLHGHWSSTRLSLQQVRTGGMDRLRMSVRTIQEIRNADPKPDGCPFSLPFQKAAFFSVGLRSFFLYRKLKISLGAMASEVCSYWKHSKTTMNLCSGWWCREIPLWQCFPITFLACLWFRQWEHGNKTKIKKYTRKLEPSSYREVIICNCKDFTLLMYHYVTDCFKCYILV